MYEYYEDFDFFLVLNSSRWSKTSASFLSGRGWVCSVERHKITVSEETVFHLQITYLASSRFLNLYFRTLLSKSTGKKQDVLQLQHRVK